MIPITTTFGSKKNFGIQISSGSWAEKLEGKDTQNNIFPGFSGEFLKSVFTVTSLCDSVF